MRLHGYGHTLGMPFCAYGVKKKCSAPWNSLSSSASNAYLEYMMQETQKITET